MTKSFNTQLRRYAKRVNWIPLVLSMGWARIFSADTSLSEASLVKVNIIPSSPIGWQLIGLLHVAKGAHPMDERLEPSTHNLTE